MNIPIEGTIQFLRGDTFQIELELEDGPLEDPQPVVIDPDDIKSQIRDKKGQLLCELAVSNTGLAPGTYLLSYDGPTDAWAIKQYYVDVRTEISSVLRRTRRWAIDVIPEVTKNEVI